MNQVGVRSLSGGDPLDARDSRAETRVASGTAPGEWLVNVEGDVVVPMTTGGIVERLREGKLSEHSLVWRIGMHDWTTLFEVPQLRLAASSLTAKASPGDLQPEPKERTEPPRRREPLLHAFPAVRDSASVEQPNLPNSLAPTSTESGEALAREADSGSALRVQQLSKSASDPAIPRRAWRVAGLASLVVASGFAFWLERSPAQHGVPSGLPAAGTALPHSIDPQPPTTAPDVFPSPNANPIRPAVVTLVSKPRPARPKAIARTTRADSALPLPGQSKQPPAPSQPDGVSAAPPAPTTPPEAATPAAAATPPESTPPPEGATTPTPVRAPATTSTSVPPR